MKRWLFFILFIGWMVYISAFPPSMLPNETSKTQPEDLLQESKSILVENTLSIRDLSNITKEEINRKTISFKPLEHCAYYAPYFIFQATYGEIASDYYLFSLNTQTGELVKIHKGFHGDFWIKGDRFTFRHTDHIYQCTIPNWKQLAEIKMQTWDDMIASREGKLNENKTPIRQSYSCELPPALRLLDWEYIYCVMEGSFTRPNQKEILFISGRKPTYDIAVYQWSNKKMIALESLGKKSQDKDWLNIASKNDENMVNFRQAVFEDFDHDGCLEIFINGVYASWGNLADPLIYLNFSGPFSGKRFQLHPFEKLMDTEIIRMNNDIILFGEDYDENERKTKVFRITPPDHKEIINLTEINPVPQETKRWIKSVSHQSFNNSFFFGSERKHLSFAKTGRNLLDAGNPVTLKSKKLPNLVICPLYNANNPDLTLREKLYHAKRNEFLRNYIKRLDSGWIPFNDFSSIYGEMFHFLNDDKTAFSNMNSMVDLIPILTKEETLFVAVIRFFKELGIPEPDIRQTFLFLYNNQFQLLDYQELDTGYITEEYEIYLPLPHEAFVLTKSHTLRGYNFYTYQIEKNTIKKTLSLYGGFNLFTLHNQLILHYSHNNNFLVLNWGGSGRGVAFSYDYFIDPINQEIKDLQFKKYFQNQLVYMYYKYHFFNYRGDVTDLTDKADKEIIKYLERYEKNIYYHELAPMVEDDDGER